jgi:hypothetical protein
LGQYEQVTVKYIEQFPKLPEPYEFINWKRLAEKFVSVVFNEELEGPYLPLVKIKKKDETATSSYHGDLFVLPSYIGQEQDFGEALSCIGSVLGASLSGEDMSNYNRRNWVEMCKAYFTLINEHGLVLNDINVDNTCGSFWYDIFPSCLFYHLGALYPDNEPITKIMKDIAEGWLAALPALYGNWDHTGFSFKEMGTVDSGKWIEPDAAIGIAYIEYMAYLKWGEVKFLDAAKTCMKQMEAYSENPYYEILGSYGPYLAARMNSEENMTLSVGKFLQFVFDHTSSARPGWGIINERWGNDDAYGLSGSTTDTSGYAFSMNTYTTAAFIAPMVRYAPEYSRAVGRYLLHVSSNSRLYFPDKVNQDMQSDYDWYLDTKVNSISYEGVRHKGETTPYSTGDAKKPRLNFNPYGAWGIGFMAAIYDRTNVEGILRVDVLKTDFEHGTAYPTYLYYNPFDKAKTVEILLGDQESDLYDCVSKTFLERNVNHNTVVSIEADEALLIVVVPSRGNLTWDHGKMLIDDIIVDYKGNYELYDKDDVKIPSYQLALNKEVKASSEKNANYGCGNVNDADWRTRWVSDKEQVQWIYVDLQEVYLIEKVNLRWYEFAHAVSYKLQVSKSGEDWSDVYSTHSGDGHLDAIKLETPAEGQFIRLYCLDKGGANEYSIIEFEVYGGEQKMG